MPTPSDQLFADFYPSQIAGVSVDQYDFTAAARIEPKQGRTWLDQYHPDYVRNLSKWLIAGDHYSGDVLRRSKIFRYLIRRAQGEAEQAFFERAALADYTPHFAAIVDALAGMLFAVEGDANRFMGDEKTPGLGDIEDVESSAFRLWKDADGQGTGWITLFKQLAIDLIVAHRSWVIVTKNSADQAVVRNWPATAVTNWWHDGDGRMSEVVLTEYTDRRKSVKDDVKAIRRRWIVYQLEGWEVWEKDEKERTPIKVDGGEYEKPFEDENGDPILPIFPVELPMKRHVGWLLAQKANAIFNKESERDHILRVANFPILLIVGSDKQYKEAVEDLKKGVRAMRMDPQYGTAHQFIAPQAEAARVATDVLKRKVEEFYVTAFREYGDAAQERTATEVRQDVSAGVGAFLTMLKSAVDDAENETMKRVAQIEHSTDKRRWFVNKVDRSETFIPTDVQTIIDNLKARYFKQDTPLPLGPTGLANIVKQVAAYDGVAIDEEELKGAIMTGELHRLLDLFKELPIPAEVRVKATLDLLVSLGYVDPEETVEIDEDIERKLIDVLKEEMLDLAIADDEARKRMAQPLEAPIPPGREGADIEEEEEEEEE